MPATRDNDMKKLLLVLGVGLAVAGCARLDFVGKEPLRVGVSPNYPPLIFVQEGELAGLEMDLMRRLGRELKRPVTAVPLPWEEQMDALVAGKIDIIMSGMSVTDARKVKIGFTDPWMKSGQMAMMRRADAAAITSVDHVRNFSGNIGVLPNTTSQDWAKRNCPNARLIKIASAADAGIQLQKKRIDLFIHDIPSIAWQVASNEAELAPLLIPLEREDIAWGVRRGDAELTAQINQLIKAWQEDGSLEEAILAWIPYYAKLK